MHATVLAELQFKVCVIVLRCLLLSIGEIAILNLL